MTLAAGPNIVLTPSGNTLTVGGADSPLIYTAKNKFPDFGGTDTSFGADVISKAVPAGSYLIFYKGQLQNGSGTLTEGYTCTLSTGDSGTIILQPQGDLDHGIIILQDVATFPVPATITVHCAGNAGHVNISVLTAIRVADVF
ncbi:MAG: hypothetical protein ACREDR_15900 [Blastocatellia bacterium]